MPFIPSILPPAQSTPQSWCFAFVGNQLLLPEDEGLELQPLVAAAMMAEASASHYLGTLAAIDCWALLMPAVPAGWRAVPLRTAMMRFDAARGALAGRAAQLLECMYSALAGFVEAGESLEDCVHREVAEEVGLQIQGLRYYGSQSWPFPNSLMVAYTAEYVSGEIVPQPGEIEDAQWFSIDALPSIPPRFSISGHLIRDTMDAMRAGTFRSTR